MEGTPYLSVALFIPLVGIIALLVMLIVSMRLVRRGRKQRRGAERVGPSQSENSS